MRGALQPMQGPHCGPTPIYLAPLSAMRTLRRHRQTAPCSSNKSITGRRNHRSPLLATKPRMHRRKISAHDNRGIELHSCRRDIVDDLHAVVRPPRKIRIGDRDNPGAARLRAASARTAKYSSRHQSAEWIEFSPIARRSPSGFQSPASSQISQTLPPKPARRCPRRRLISRLLPAARAQNA